MLSVYQKASDTVTFSTTFLYKKILSTEQKPGLCHYVIKFLFINLIMKYPRFDLKGGGHRRLATRKDYV